MKAVILAAGVGSRLQPITDTCPKGLVPVAGKPMMGYAVEAFGAAGFSEVLVVSGHLADQVYSIERIAGLARPATRRLRDMGLTNVHVKTFDGTYGWRDRAPFQGIVVTAGAPEIPRTLAEQLAEGGRMIVPVGERGGQVLKRIFRDGTGFRVEDHGPCQFVPLIGRFGWEESGGL